MAGRKRDALSHIVFRSAEDMREIRDGKARLTLLSPPYVEHHSQNGKEREFALLDRLLAECARVTAPDGVVATYNTDIRDRGGLYARHLAVIRAAEANGLELFAERIRVRTFKQDLYRLGFSFVLMFRHRDAKVRINKKLPEYERSVWHLPRNQYVLGFRDAMPPEVACFLIANFTDLGDLVVSSCAGSGTAMITALKMRRRALGYEIDTARTPIIRERERRFAEFFSDPVIYAKSAMG